MTIKQVKCIPTNNKNVENLRMFIESGWTYAEVDIDRSKKSATKTAYMGLRKAISRNNEFAKKVRVVTSNGRVFLERIDKIDELGAQV